MMHFKNSLLLTAKTMLYLIQSIIFQRPHFSDFSRRFNHRNDIHTTFKLHYQDKSTYPFLRIDTII
jgi:hypothetical protein